MLENSLTKTKKTKNYTILHIYTYILYLLFSIPKINRYIPSRPYLYLFTLLISSLMSLLTQWSPHHITPPLLFVPLDHPRVSPYKLTRLSKHSYLTFSYFQFFYLHTIFIFTLYTYTHTIYTLLIKLILDIFSSTHYALNNMSRTQTINETLAILGKILPEQGFDELNSDKLQEIYTTIENDKNQKDIIASELGFKFRKRSIKKDSSPDEEHKPKKVTRKSGYALFPGDESKYIDRIQELKGSTDDDGKEITAIKARAIVWKELSEAEKEPFNDKATQLNRDNGFEEKKTPSPKQTKLTKAQLEQQLHDSQELLRQNGVTDMPAPPPREVKPKKAKKDKNDSDDSNPASPLQEQPVLSPPVPMPQSAHEGSDSDSDSDDESDDYNHIQWTINLVNDSDESGQKADFIAWLIANDKANFGPSKRNTLYNEAELKKLKNEHDFKNKKKDPSADWYDFIKIHSSD